MKLRTISLALAIAAIPSFAHAWDIHDLLSKAGEAVSNVNAKDVTSSIGNIVNGLFSKSDLEVKDIAGTWVIDGAAVSFQSDNFLQKAGGAAAATMVENKLNPYFQKYGLTGSILTIEEDGNFTLSLKKLTLSGTVTKQEERKGEMTQGGNFFFNFNKFGVSTLGNINTYVTKGATNLEVMFDASKLQAIMNAISSFSKIQLAKTATQLLNQYDGICIGFNLSPYVEPVSGKKNAKKK